MVRWEQWVTVMPGVCGGLPCVRMTRIPVRLLSQFHEYGSTVNQIIALYPQLSIGQVLAALAWDARFGAAWPDP